MDLVNSLDLVNNDNKQVLCLNSPEILSKNKNTNAETVIFPCLVVCLGLLGTSKPFFLLNFLLRWLVVIVY